MCVCVCVVCVSVCPTSLDGTHAPSSEPLLHKHLAVFTINYCDGDTYISDAKNEYFNLVGENKQKCRTDSAVCCTHVVC